MSLNNDDMIIETTTFQVVATSGTSQQSQPNVDFKTTSSKRTLCDITDRGNNNDDTHFLGVQPIHIDDDDVDNYVPMDVDIVDVFYGIRNNIVLEEPNVFIPELLYRYKHESRRSDWPIDGSIIILAILLFLWRLSFLVRGETGTSAGTDAGPEEAMVGEEEEEEEEEEEKQGGEAGEFDVDADGSPTDSYTDAEDDEPTVLIMSEPLFKRRKLAVIPARQERKVFVTTKQFVCPQDVSFVFVTQNNQSRIKCNNKYKQLKKMQTKISKRKQ